MRHDVVNPVAQRRGMSAQLKLKGSRGVVTSGWAGHVIAYKSPPSGIVSAWRCSSGDVPQWRTIVIRAKSNLSPSPITSVGSCPRVGIGHPDGKRLTSTGFASDLCRLARIADHAVGIESRSLAPTRTHG